MIILFSKKGGTMSKLTMDFVNRNAHIGKGYMKSKYVFFKKENNYSNLIAMKGAQ